jgi:hypothetical protein
MGIHLKIANDTKSVAFRDQEFEYLMNNAENEVIDSPQNSALMNLDGSENFIHPLKPDMKGKETMV